MDHRTNPTWGPQLISKILSFLPTLVTITVFILAVDLALRVFASMAGGVDITYKAGTANILWMLSEMAILIPYSLWAVGEVRELVKRLPPEDEP